MFNDSIIFTSFWFYWILICTIGDIIFDLLSFKFLNLVIKHGTNEMNELLRNIL